MGQDFLLENSQWQVLKSKAAGARMQLWINKNPCPEGAYIIVNLYW